MVRTTFVLLIILHGFVHLTGFLKAFGFAKIEQLKLAISPMAGLLWLISFLLLLATAGTYIREKDWWWMVGSIAVAISQVLIVIYWQDTKFGTLANVIILIGCLLGYGNWSFNSMLNHEFELFWDGAPEKVESISPSVVEELPPIVQRWLQKSGINKLEKVQIARFRQTGEMKTSPAGNWMPFEAKQDIRIRNPAFLWVMNVEVAPYIHLAGRDKYIDGKGHMLIKLLSLFPVADAKGPQIDQGTLLRYLAEMVWYPSAAVEEYISWEQLDSTTAKATMSYGNITASGLFRFAKNGKVRSFEAKRYYDRGQEQATLEPWVVNIDADSYQSIQGVCIPTEAEVTWKLDQGNFTWYKVKIIDGQFF